MFEVTMLGTSSATPTIQRSLPSIAVRREGAILLLDCGEGTQRQMMRYGLSYMKVKAILITHLHLDHFLGVFGIVETMALNGRKEKLVIYGPAGSRAVFNKKDFVEIVEFSEGGPLADFGEFSVFAFENTHSKNSFGFVLEEKDRRRFHEAKAKGLGIKGPMFSQIMEKGKLVVNGKTIKLSNVTYAQPGKKLVYTGDTPACASVVKAAKGADLLIHESTFCSDRSEEASEAHHSTAADAAKDAKKAGVKKLLLTHISGRYRDTKQLLDEAKPIFDATVVAEDGMKLDV